MRIMDMSREFRRFEPGQQRRYFNGPVPFNSPEVRAWLEALSAEVEAGRAFIFFAIYPLQKRADPIATTSAKDG